MSRATSQILTLARLVEGLQHTFYNFQHLKSTKCMLQGVYEPFHEVKLVRGSARCQPCLLDIDLVKKYVRQSIRSYTAQCGKVYIIYHLLAGLATSRATSQILTLARFVDRLQHTFYTFQHLKSTKCMLQGVYELLYVYQSSSEASEYCIIDNPEKDAHT